MRKPRRADDGAVAAVDAEINSVMLAHVLPEHPVTSAVRPICCSCGHAFAESRDARILASEFTEHLAAEIFARFDVSQRTNQFESVRSPAPVGENAGG